MNIHEELDAAHKAFEAKDAQGASDLLIKILDEEPETAQAHALMADVLIVSGKLKEALQAIHNAISLDPQAAEYHFKLGQLLRYIGRDDMALPAFVKAVEIAPNYLPAILQLGELYLHERNPLKALDVMDSALKHVPDHPQLLRARAVALQESGQLDEALLQLSAIPASSDMGINLGQIRREKGQISAAEEHFLQSLTHPATAASSFRQLIDMSLAQEGKMAAIAKTKDLLERTPAEPLFKITAASLLCELGDYDSTYTLIDELDRDKGPHPAWASIRAKALLEQGHVSEVLPLLRPFSEKGALTIDMLEDVMQAKLRLGDAQGTLDLIAQIRQQAPGAPGLIAYESLALRQLGRDPGPLYDYDKFVKTYPIPVPAEYGDLETFLAELKKSLLPYHEQDHIPMGSSARWGSQTMVNLVFAKDRVIQDYFQALYEPLQEYMGAMEDDKDHLFYGRNTGAHRLFMAWSVQLQSGGHHANHIHLGAWISSAFYVSLPEGLGVGGEDHAGWLKFGEPPFDIEGPKGRLGPEHWVQPSPGRLVLFPSYVWHGTEPFDGKGMRLTLPFDVVPERV